VKIGNPVIILAASSCNFQVWLNNTLHNYPIFHRHIQKLGEYILSTVFLDFVYTSLGYSSQNVVEIENVINHDLCELNTWSTKWLMSFNPDKTEIMFSIPKCLDTFKVIFSMWLFHLASLDKVTPKCLWLIVIGILFPLNEKLKLYL
jgi:hypothetical protein